MVGQRIQRPDSGLLHGRTRCQIVNYHEEAHVYCKLSKAKIGNNLILHPTT
jgi:hypothetical protein